MSTGAEAGLAGRTAGPGLSPPVPVLELEAVSKVYPGSPPVRALDRVSVAVAAGELTGIVGPSGSGKGTLLHLMGTLDRPTSGTVRVTGLDIARMTDRELSALRAARIGFVFQQLGGVRRSDGFRSNTPAPAALRDPGSDLRESDIGTKNGEHPGSGQQQGRVRRHVGSVA
jgi:predicted ABC-type transport system involved in lysophospholipase L1 biosynthesis ATPase subunit